ncbi:MAG: arginine--tRNA ligase [Lachnospiraceae bacterium]
MKKLLEIITEETSAAFVQCGYDAAYGRVTVSNRPDLCEFQCNGAMAGAKKYKKAPIAIANEVVELLKDSRTFSEITAVMPGFINIKLNNEFVADYINEMKNEEKLGYKGPEAPETIVIDYGGPNVAKPLHVGHLRSAVIGESLKRICRFMGHKVIGDVHLGDWGLQMGLIIEEVKDRNPELCYFDENFTGEYPSEAPFTISELEEIYPKASAKSKVDEAFAKRAHDATFRLQNGDAGYTALWNHIMRVSVADLKKNYKSLNVEFDLWKKESDAQPYIPAMVEDMKEKGLAYTSQGALVIDVKEETDTKEIPPCILLKSDGATLYSTTDLATIVEREKLFQPDQIIYVVDKRQEMHFTQVFRCAKKAELTDAKLKFLGFGTMNGKDGKPFKTREGGVMRLENLISDISKAVYNKIMENRTVSEDEAKDTSGIIGIAALKYGDLSNQASKDYVFDVDRFISFEGDTGPYILYTIVRIKSILKKYEETKQNCSDSFNVLPATSDSQKALMLQLTSFQEMLLQSYEELAPHKICSYIYDLSNAFNRFYHDTKILIEENEEVQKGYIALIDTTKRVLEVCIDLLGFEAPDRM